MKVLIHVMLVLHINSSLLHHRSEYSSKDISQRGLKDFDEHSSKKIDKKLETKIQTANQTKNTMSDFTTELNNVHNDLKMQKHILKMLEKKHKKHRKAKKQHKNKHRKLKSKSKKRVHRNHKTHDKTTEAQKRKLLLKKFYSLDNKEQVRKLVSIYKTYGISINKLASKDLKYIIKNSKQLLEKYHNGNAEEIGDTPQDRGLEGVTVNGDATSQAAYNAPQMAQSPNQQTQYPQGAYQSGQAYQQQAQQPPEYQTGAQRQLMLPPAAEKGAMEQLKADRVSGGTMAVKFPDTPPTTFVTQQPYYSY